MTDPDPSLLLSFRSHLRACTSCELSQSATPVPWSGDVGADLTIIAEAPGRQEDREGKPLVGPTGMQLRFWLKEVGIDMSKCVLTNAVQCLPHGTPTPDHMKACRPWLNGTLEFTRPKMILTLGVVASSQLRQQTWPKLQHLHGKPQFHPRFFVPVFSSYHPAAYLRGKSRKYEQLIRDDLRAMADWDGTYPEDCVVCGDAFYTFDEWGCAYCERHAARQGLLFNESVGVTT